MCITTLFFSLLVFNMSKIDSMEPVSIERLELAIVGLIYIVISTTMIVPYVICLHILHNETKLKHLSFYRLAKFIGICDVSTLLHNGVFAGICCLMPAPMPYMIQKANSGILCQSWFTYMSLTHVIAINRFVATFY